MHLADVNEKLNHRIVSGSEYQWGCYPDARYLDYESDYAYVTVVYSTVTQEIYEAEISVKTDAWVNEHKPYRWLNPMYKSNMIFEADHRNVVWNQAWDDVKWVDLEVEQDFLEKTVAIFNGEEFDERVQVEIDLDEETMLQVAMEAHKRDLTFNQMVEEILRNMIAKYDSEQILNRDDQE